MENKKFIYKGLLKQVFIKSTNKWFHLVPNTVYDMEKNILDDLIKEKELNQSEIVLFPIVKKSVPVMDKIDTNFDKQKLFKNKKDKE